jgi:hypothetical protein
VVSPWWAVTLLPLLAGFYSARAFAFGMLLVIPAVVVAATISEKRRRRSVLHTSQLPIAIGHRFSGYIDVELDLVPEQDFWLVLRCTEPDVGSENGSRLTLWQDELTVRAVVSPRSAHCAEVPFSFEMPTTGKPSDLMVKWELRISSKGYDAEFKLPVVDSSVTPAVTDERTRMFSTVRRSLRR